MQARYLHGHHRSVIEAHGARTAADSAAYLLPRLTPGMRVLDLGCGPGTITLDLAAAVDDGPGGHCRVIGVENTAAPLRVARANAAARTDDGDVAARVTFVLADACSLPFPDGWFDLAHAHQVLQHLPDPVAALTELARVTRGGGVIAARDADYASMAWHPDSPGLTRWLRLYRTLARRAGGEPDAGRRLLGWAHAAGLADVAATTSTWSYATAEARAWWGGRWAERATQSAFATQALDAGLATPDDLAEIADAWTAWSVHPDGWFAMMHGEVVAILP